MNFATAIVPFIGVYCWWLPKHRKRDDFFAVVHFSISNEYKKKEYFSTTFAFGFMGLVVELGVQVDENYDDLFY